MASPSQSDDSDSGDDSSDTLLVLPLLRRLLPVQTGEADEHSGSPNEAPSREEAGTMLWDGAAGRKQAKVLVEKGSFLQLFPVLIDQAMQGEDFRMAEVLLGILGNILTHGSLASKVCRRPQRLDRGTVLITVNSR
jgi:hypothetical protein